MNAQRSPEAREPSDLQAALQPGELNLDDIDLSAPDAEAEASRTNQEWKQGETSEALSGLEAEVEEARETAHLEQHEKTIRTSRTSQAGKFQQRRFRIMIRIWLALVVLLILIGIQLWWFGRDTTTTPSEELAESPAPSFSREQNGASLGAGDPATTSEVLPTLPAFSNAEPGSDQDGPAGFPLRPQGSEVSEETVAFSADPTEDTSAEAFPEQQTPLASSFGGEDARSSGPAERPASGGGTHRVERGDTLWDIAKRWYAQALIWPRIFQGNRSQVSNPNRIHPGWELEIPRLEGSGPALTEDDQKQVAADYLTVYRVFKRLGIPRAGDYLREALRRDASLARELPPDLSHSSSSSATR